MESAICFLSRSPFVCVSQQMLLRHTHTIFPLRDQKIRTPKRASTKGLSFWRRSTIIRCYSQETELHIADGTIERIKEMFMKDARLSVSAFDTASMAMIPSRDSPKKPFFPECLEWIMENQQQDGSWGLNPRNPSLLKDYLFCTLACLLALQKWRVGEQLVHKGIEFLRSNAWAAISQDQCRIVFPTMIKAAEALGLDLKFDPVLVDQMIGNRAHVIDSQKGKEVLAFVNEGLEESCFWEDIRNQQSSNCSLLNSPASISGGLTHDHDDKRFEYLFSVLNAYKYEVLTTYPRRTFARLYMVDAVERLGVERYFLKEIECVLYDVYRSWVSKSDEIFSDITCCAMAFRLLRQNGYEVSSDELARFSDQEQFFRTISMQYTSLTSILELHKASQVIIHPNDDTLEKINAWTSSYMRNQLRKTNRLKIEVEISLQGIRGIKRVQTRQTLDYLCHEDNFQIFETSYRCPKFVNQDLLTFSKHDFTFCQALHLREIQQLERWYKESRLDQVKGVRNIISSFYFLIAADFFGPDFSEARIAFVRNVVLITHVDDIFDNCGSMEEMHNIMDLATNWDEHASSNYSSERVAIIFSAIRDTVNEIAVRALDKQGRCIKNHLISLWSEIVECMMKEAEWWKYEKKPTVDEYLSAGCVTIGCKLCTLQALYVVGPTLSNDVMSSEECGMMVRHVSTVARVMNDIQTFKKEQEERKPNSVSLLVVEGHGVITEEEAKRKLKRIAENSCRHLLQMVLQTKGSLVPKACKDLFWTICKISLVLYSDGDEFTSPTEVLKNIKALISNPIDFPLSKG